MCILSINIDLVHEWKLHIELLFGFLFYYCIRVGLLLQKLVTWEAHNLKPVLLIPFVQLSQLLVVALGKGSQ